MSNLAQSWVWRFSRSQKFDRFVLLYLAYRYNEDKHRAWPAIGSIAEACGVSESTVKNSLKNLQELGEVRVTLRPREEGSNDTNFYEMPPAQEWIEKIVREGRAYREGGGVTGEPQGVIEEPQRGRGVTPNSLSTNSIKEHQERNEDPKEIFKLCKRYYRRKTGKSCKNIPPGRAEEWIRSIEKKTGDVVFEAFKLWTEEQDRDFLRKMNWPMAVFMKHIAENIEAFEDKSSGEAIESEEGRLPQLKEWE